MACSFTLLCKVVKAEKKLVRLFERKMDKQNGSLKNIVVLVGLLFLGINVYSQDILIKKNGDELEVKVTKISDVEVEYKKWSNQEGPSYVLPKSDVFMIKYKNGDKDVFNESDVSSVSQLEQVPVVSNLPVKAQPAADNADLIEQFNQVDNALFESLKTKWKDKKAKFWWGTLGVTRSSVLSSAEVQISVSTEEKSYPYYPSRYDGGLIKGFYGDKYTYFEGKYVIEVVNKTAQTIYIDKANTFRVESDGNSYVYYNAQQTTVNQGGGSGASLNVGAVTGAFGLGGVANALAGGVNVGGGSQASVSTTYAEQRVVPIPPYGKVVLSKDTPVVAKRSQLRYDHFKMTSFSEDCVDIRMPALKYGEYRTFSEQDTPGMKRYILLYSTDPEFKSSKQIEFALYVKDVIGAKRFSSYLEGIVEDMSGQKGYVIKSVLVGNEL